MQFSIRKADRAVSAGEDGNVVIWDITNGTNFIVKLSKYKYTFSTI